MHTVYRYDGSFAGLLCCLAQCFRDKKLPQAVQLMDEPQETLFPLRAVETDGELARQVEQSLRQRLGRQGAQMLREGFLCRMRDKELTLLRFALLGWKYGPKVCGMTANDDVHALNAALLNLKNEAHFQIELLRFADCGGFLAAEIRPENNVLPLIAGHFCDRFNGEKLMIYDRTHGLGLLYTGGRAEFFHADNVELPPPDEEERQIQALWRRFYDSVAIEGRKNEKLRMSHMPKKYWDLLPEMRGAAPRLSHPD